MVSRVRVIGGDLSTRRALIRREIVARFAQAVVYAVTVVSNGEKGRMRAIGGVNTMRVELTRFRSLSRSDGCRLSVHR